MFARAHERFNVRVYENVSAHVRARGLFAFGSTFLPYHCRTTYCFTHVHQKWRSIFTTSSIPLQPFALAPSYLSDTVSSVVESLLFP